MKRLFFLTVFILNSLFFNIAKIYSQCPNLNFSMGNFANWQGYLGSCDSGNITINPSTTTPGRHTIMNGTQLLRAGQLYDEQCPKIKKVPDGFAYSAKIGNSGTGAEMEAIEYTLTVDSTNSLLLVHFAWVVEDPSHSANEQPRFSMQIRDSAGNAIPETYLPCSFSSFLSAGVSSLVCSTSSLLGHDWITIGYSLESFIGQTIKIYFETRDCTCGGHFGYAYVVAECRSMTIDLMYCKGQTSCRLRAPDGFKRYTWTRSSNPNWSHTGTATQSQNIIITDPVDGETFTCIMSSGDGWDWTYCAETLHKVIEKTIIDANFAYGVMEYGEVDFRSHNNQNWYDTCNRTATFVDRSKVVNSKQSKRSWTVHGLNMGFPNDSMVTITFPDPGLATPPKDSVRYLVRLTVQAEDGCIDTSKNTAYHYITIYASPRVRIEVDGFLCNGNTTHLKVRSLRSEFIHHIWSWKDTNNIFQTVNGDSVQIDNEGKYALVSQDKLGCFASDSVTISILKPTINNLTVKNAKCYGENTGEFSHGQIIGANYAYTQFTWTLFDKDGNDSIVNGNPHYGLFQNLQVGIYRFKAEDTRGCILLGSVEVKQNDSLKISAISYPEINGSGNGSLKLEATGGIRPYKFKIEKDSSLLESISDSVWNLNAGIYTITVIDAVDCVTSDTISINSAVVNGIKEINTFPLLIYPNPASSKLHIQFKAWKIANYSIYNILGQRISQGNLYEEISTINIESFPKGIYYLKIEGKENAVVKFVKQ